MFGNFIFFKFQFKRHGNQITTKKYHKLDIELYN